MGYTPEKGLIEKFHAAAYVPADVTPDELESRLELQVPTLERAIRQQQKWLQEWERAARQDGVDHSVPPDSFSVIAGLGLRNIRQDQIQQMPGYHQMHQICADMNVEISIVRNDNGLSHIKINVGKPYAQSLKTQYPAKPSAPPRDPSNRG